MLPKYYSAIHPLIMSPLRSKKSLTTKLYSYTQWKKAFPIFPFFLSTSVYVWEFLLSIPNIFCHTVSPQPKLTMFLNILITTLDKFVMKIITVLPPLMLSPRHFVRFKMLFQGINQKHYISKENLIWHKPITSHRKNASACLPVTESLIIIMDILKQKISPFTSKFKL